MKRIYNLLFALVALVAFGSCNDEWTEELYEHYVSFKAPINSNGVSRINIPYKAGQVSTYQLPVLVSGSTANQQKLMVKIGIDKDTLDVLNEARFSSRDELYYKELDAKHYSFPETVEIQPGENSTLLNIDFNLTGLDLVEKWVLPLTIEESPTGEYTPNYRKHYRKALLRVMPFNKYSGTYSGTALMNYMKNAGDGGNDPLVKSEIVSYAVDENTIFFYAGTIDETRKDRANYKIKAFFDPESNKVNLTCDNGEVNFRTNKQATYFIKEEMDEKQPYLLKRTIMIRDIDYDYTDYTMAPSASIEYNVKGEMSILRKINTQIPDEDQAIEWD